MQIKVFTLPLQPNDEQTEELNHFLRANKVVDIKKELANVGGNSVWTFCIVYLETATKTTEANNFSKGQKVDYREILPPNIFERFAALRKLLPKKRPCQPTLYLPTPNWLRWPNWQQSPPTR